MRLWLLRPVDGLDEENNPWEPWWDKAFGFVVRAESEDDARKLAHEEAGNENGSEFLEEETGKTRSPWLDVHYSRCTELTADGPAGIVMQDFARG